MKHYIIYLPIYTARLSSRFISFVRETSDSNKLPEYLLQLNNNNGQNRLSFIPSESPKLKKASIPESSLRPSGKKFRLKDVSRFASQFNMLASVAHMSGRNKCEFTIKLLKGENSQYPYSNWVVEVSLKTKDLATSIAVENLFMLWDKYPGSKNSHT